MKVLCRWSSTQKNKSAWEIADQCRSEYVVEITGTVIRRDAGAVNKKMATGDFEVKGEEIVILNSAKTPPFSIEDEQNISDEVRLKYRYMDLRRPKMTQILDHAPSFDAISSSFLG